MRLEPGTIYIGKGDADVIVGTRLKGIVAMPVPAKPVLFWHPSVERMVASALEFTTPTVDRRHDDRNGKRRRRGDVAIKGRRGHTIAQAENTAVVWGMPGEARQSLGAPSRVAPIEEICGPIIEMVAGDAPR